MRNDAIGVVGKRSTLLFRVGQNKGKARSAVMVAHRSQAVDMAAHASRYPGVLVAYFGFWF